MESVFTSSCTDGMKLHHIVTDDMMMERVFCRFFTATIITHYSCLKYKAAQNDKPSTLFFQFCGAFIYLISGFECACINFFIYLFIYVFICLCLPLNHLCVRYSVSHLNLSCLFIELLLNKYRNAAV